MKLFAMKLFAAAIAFALAGTACAQDHLVRVVLVQRHGVRSPTKPPIMLAPYAAQSWPGWPVLPGDLTAHGAADVELMGGWLRAHYAQLGLLPAKGCPATTQIIVHADGADSRTRESGQKFLDGAFPGCGFTAQSGPPGAADPLFAAVEAGAETLDPAAERAAMRQQLARPDPGEQAAKLTLAKVLGDPWPGCTANKGRCFLALPDQVKIAKGGAKLSGALATAAALTENFALEYDEGMPMSQVGWGRLTLAQLRQVMTLHNRGAAIERANPYSARHNGAVLARAIARDLAHGPLLTLYAGHDTNLSNLAGILGLNWNLPDQADATPPSGTLAFELWQTPAGKLHVTVRLFYPTNDQLRGTTLAGGARGITLLDAPDVARRLTANLP